MNKFNIKGVKTAHSVQLCICENPECSRIHVILLDDKCKPIAQFIPGKGFGNYFTEIEKGQ